MSICKSREMYRYLLPGATLLIPDMITNKKVLLAGSLLLIAQLIYFHDYIFPFFWGELKVSGQACTCPDEKVVNGQAYLRAITPDSLKRYDIDYSEIYVTERPATRLDPMGSDQYIIKGSVIGLKRVSESDPWNLELKVNKWREVDILYDLVIKVFFFMQLFLFIAALRLTRNRAMHNPVFPQA